jgi:hypothetical protein
MQSFHTGQRAFRIADVRTIMAGAGEEAYFIDMEGAASFVKCMKESDAYHDLTDTHFEVLWKVIHESPERSLKSAIANRDLLARIAFQDQSRMIAFAAATYASGSRSDPVAKILFGGFSSAASLITPDSSHAS